jgi:predicted transglutaminase-like cysteine proteinase
MRKYLKNRAPLSLIFAILIGLFIAKPVITAEDFHLDKEVLKKVELKCGKEALVRTLAWENLIRQDKGTSDREEREKTNNFFNSRYRFDSDWNVWGVEDYWATPLESLCKGAGDCDCFAIAKYFTLRAMGMPDDKLNLAYVKALQYNVHHMVLLFISEPGAEPLILDNLIDGIAPASKRTDLLPIFSFNATGLWMAKQRGQGKMAGSSSRIKSWQDVLQKMAVNKF